MQVLHVTLANPVATIALFLFLWIDATVISQHHPSHSTLIGWLRAAFPGFEARRTTGPHPIWSSFAVREPEGFRLIDPDNESWDEATRLLARRHDDVVQITLWRFITTEGFWAPTRRVAVTRLMITSMSSRLPSDGLASLRTPLMALSPAPHILIRDALASALGVADIRTEDVLWFGYVHSGAALLALLGLVYSLQWVPRAPAWFRARRQARAERAGRCPRCGYSIAGLPEARCPECGEDLTPSLALRVPPETGSPP